MPALQFGLVDVGYRWLIFLTLVKAFWRVYKIMISNRGMSSSKFTSPPSIGWQGRRGLQDAGDWDVTQEVLGKVCKSLDEWDPDKTKGTFGGWL